MILKNMMNKIKSRIIKKMLLWVLVPLIVFAPTSKTWSMAVTLTASALQVLQSFVYACYGMTYQNAFNINHQLLTMPQLSDLAVQHVQNGILQMHRASSNTMIQPSAPPAHHYAQAYKSTYTQGQLTALRTHIFGNTFLSQPIKISDAPRNLAPPSIFKTPQTTAGYNDYANVVGNASLWNKVSLQCSVGGQSFQRGAGGPRLENMKSLFSSTNAFFTQINHLDFLDAKLMAVEQSPIVHTYMHAAKDLFHEVIVNGVDVTQAVSFMKNVTHLYESISDTMSQVDFAQAAALGDVRQAVNALMYESHTKRGDFLGIVTAGQKQAVSDTYARMLGELTQGGFERTLDAHIADGATYLIPSRDFYFPKGWSKILYVPLNALRESFSIRGSNVASAWCHGGNITKKIGESALNKAIHKVQSLMRHGFVTLASGAIEDFNPAHHKDGRRDYAHCYTVLKDTLSVCKAATLNEFGIPKVFEIHPQWEDFKSALIKDPSCQSKILWQLEHEQAFAFKLLHDMRITNPSENQLKSVYELCKYSDLYCFDRIVSHISTLSDVPIAADNLVRSYIECNTVRDNLLQLGFTPHQFEAHIPKIMQFVRDPQCVPSLKILKEQSGSMQDFFKLMHERENASARLLSNAGIRYPSAFEKQFSYHLIDIMHDKFQVIELLNNLDPRHDDVSVREAYQHFFDAFGLQKLLPINDRVRNLLHERLGSPNLHEDSGMRLLSNQLSLFNASDDAQLGVIDRGCQYIAQGGSAMPSAGFMREYAERYVQALIEPNETNARTLSLSELFDGYALPMPDEIRAIYTELCIQALEPTNQSNTQLDIVQGLKTAASHIRTENFASAQDVLKLITQPAPADDPLPISVSTYTKVLQLNKDMHKSAFVAMLNQARRQYKPMIKGAALTPAQQHRNQLHLLQAIMRKLLPTYMPNDSSLKTKSKDPYQLARWLLKDGDIVAETQDGIVLQIDDSTLAHVAVNGHVDMFYPRAGTTDHFVGKIAERASDAELTRAAVLELAHGADANVQSHVIKRTPAHDVGDVMGKDDLLARLAKEHAERSQQHSTAASSSASGGAPPPNDPRNNRNKNRQNWRPDVPERITEKVSNMKEFFETPLGQTLKGKAQRTNWNRDKSEAATKQGRMLKLR